VISIGAGLQSLVRQGDFSTKWKVPHWESVNTTAFELSRRTTNNFRIDRHTGATAFCIRPHIYSHGLKDNIFQFLAHPCRGFSVGDPVTVESVRHAPRKLYSSDGLALEVRRIDYYQIAAVPDRVVNIGQIPAGQFARL
jgi:hypothetical protein